MKAQTIFSICALVACSILASESGPQTVMAFIIGALGVVIGIGVGRDFPRRAKR